MLLKISDKNYKEVKQINNEMIFYFLDDKLVKCKYNHQIKPRMSSNDEWFLYTEGIAI